MSIDTPKIQANSIGINFDIALTDDEGVVDCSDASVKEFIFKPRNGVAFERTAQFITDGTDGLLRYTTVDADFDLTGSWKIQAHIIVPAGEFYSSVARFVVERNID